MRKLDVKEIHGYNNVQGPLASSFSACRGIRDRSHARLWLARRIQVSFFSFWWGWR
jgi:hypothetical protein